MAKALWSMAKALWSMAKAKARALSIESKCHSMAKAKALWDPVYTVPDEFGTFFACYTGIRPVIGGLKFVWFRSFRVFTLPKGTNFMPVQNTSGTVYKRGLKDKGPSSLGQRMLPRLKRWSSLPVPRSYGG
jgi:hypothetical protein